MDSTSEAKVPATIPQCSTGKDIDSPDNELERLTDEFVIVDSSQCEESLSINQGPLYRTHLCSILVNQEKRCLHYQEYFEKLGNHSMTAQFEAYVVSTQKSIKTLEDKSQQLPSISYEAVNFSAIPFNPDVKEREVQLYIKTNDLSKDSHIQVVAEFEFPNQAESSLKTSILRWCKQTMIEPKNLFYSLKGNRRQYDSGWIEELVNLNCKSKLKGTQNPLKFFVDKGKSRTHKRKYKPVKLSFFKKNATICYRELLGNALICIDRINDESSFMMSVPIGKGRNKIGSAEVEVKVRQPLVSKTPRPIEEKILCFI